MLRLEEGAPWALAQVLRRDGQWHDTDQVMAYHLLGKNDVDINEISVKRAREIIVARHAAGKYEALPQALPGDPEAESVPRTDEQRAEHRRRWEFEAQRQEASLRRWAQVPTPPGAADVTSVPPQERFDA